MPPEVVEVIHRFVRFQTTVPAMAFWVFFGGLLAWRILKDIITFLLLPAPLRDLPSLRRDRRARAEFERRVFEIRTGEELQYRRWTAKRRRVAATAAELARLAHELAEQRKQARTDDQAVNAAIDTRLAVLMRELSGSLEAA